MAWRNEPSTAAKHAAKKAANSEYVREGGVQDHAGRHVGQPGSRLLRGADAAWGAVRNFWSLVLPTECIACGAEDVSLCASCQRAVRRSVRTPFRAEAASPALVDVDGRILLQVVAAGVYRDELARTILAYKNHGHTDLVGILAICLGIAVRAAVPSVSIGGPLLLVPVPTSGKAFQRRGYNPVYDLLTQVERMRGLPEGMEIAKPLRLKYRPAWKDASQKSLGLAGRRINARRSMTVWPWFNSGLAGQRRLAGQRCLVVDDVLTTGATVSEAARVLRGCGADVLGAVVIAAARAPDAGSSSKLPAVSGEK